MLFYFTSNYEIFQECQFRERIFLEPNEVFFSDCLCVGVASPQQGGFGGFLQNLFRPVAELFRPLNNGFRNTTCLSLNNEVQSRDGLPITTREETAPWLTKMVATIELRLTVHTTRGHTTSMHRKLAITNKDKMNFCITCYCTIQYRLN